MSFSFFFSRKRTICGSRRTRRVRPTIETLEVRDVPATGLISGTVFLDARANGGFGPGDTPLANRTVFLDANANNVLDLGETSTTTDAQGEYHFTVTTGATTHNVAVVLGQNEVLTTPRSYTAKVADDQHVWLGREFGIVRINPVVPLNSMVTTPFPDVNDGPETWVNSAYRILLHRDADPAGLQHWSSQITATAPDNVLQQQCLAVAKSLWDTAEHRGLQLESYYLTALHRAPEAEGKAGWIANFGAGFDELTVMKGFYLSPEYQSKHVSNSAFVAGLYNDVLGRAADGAAAVWEQQLAAGVTRAAVTDAFIYSVEALTRLVESQYTANLNRPADPVGLAGWVDQLSRKTVTLGEISRSLLASTENYDNDGGLAPLHVAQDVPIMTNQYDVNNPNAVVFGRADIVALNKNITIRNNSDETVYPFLAGPNDGLLQAGHPEWAYDIKDAFNQGYRAYVGYFDAKLNQTIFGLKAHKEITINVPLAFWDGARIRVTKDPGFLVRDAQFKANGAEINNPLQYYTKNQDATDVLRRIDNQTGTNGTTPVVMYYHAKDPVGPNEEGTFQLGEITIRDPIMNDLNPDLPISAPPPPQNPPNPFVGSGYLGPLFNYDISNVDSLMLPLSMEGPSVTGRIDNSVTPLPFGWVGADQTDIQFQKAIKNFTKNDPTKNGMGDYFGGLGWNSFFVPDPSFSGIKIPASKNIYELSPVNLIPSLYRTTKVTTNDTMHHVTASGGIWYQVDTQSTGKIAEVSPGVFSDTITEVDPQVMQKLAVGMYSNDTGSGAGAFEFFPPGTSIKALNFAANSIQMDNPALKAFNQVPAFSFTFIGSQFEGIQGSTNGTTLTALKPAQLVSLRAGMLVTSDGGDIAGVVRIVSVNPTAGTVTLDTSVPNSGTHSYTFKGAITDYVAQKLEGLWYGWADYWRQTVIDQTPYVGSISGGTVTNGSHVLTFPDTTHFDKLFPGMAVTGDGIPAGTVIFSKGSGNTINLSKQVTGASGGAHDYQFAVPVKIARSSEVPTSTLTFPDAAAKAKADQFAQVVYSVLQAWSTIPHTSKHTFSTDLLQNIIGGNIGKLPDVGGDTTFLGKEFTNQSKSLERGVFDFRVETEASGKWFPDPSEKTPGARVNGVDATFNLYNLDPYVWFVHKQLGVNGYAFSLDDDSADVSAVGSHELIVNIGTLNGYPNNTPWGGGAPWGVTVGAGTLTSGATPTITGLSSAVMDRLIAPNLAGGVPGALVIGPGIKEDTRILEKFDTSVSLDKPVASSGAGNYVFFNPLHFTGSIDPINRPRTISHLDATTMDILRKMTDNKTLSPKSLIIIGPGVPNVTPPQYVHIESIDWDNATLTLDTNLLTTATRGKYRFKIA